MKYCMMIEWTIDLLVVQVVQKDLCLRDNPTQKRNHLILLGSINTKFYIHVQCVHVQ